MHHVPIIFIFEGRLYKHHSFQPVIPSQRRKIFIHLKKKQSAIKPEKELQKSDEAINCHQISFFLKVWHVWWGNKIFGLLAGSKLSMVDKPGKHLFTIANLSDCKQSAAEYPCFRSVYSVHIPMNLLFIFCIKQEKRWKLLLVEENEGAKSGKSITPTRSVLVHYFDSFRGTFVYFHFFFWYEQSTLK